MKVSDKEQKLRDRVIFAFNVIPQEIDTTRTTVFVSLRQKDIDKANVAIEEVEKDLGLLIDREVKVKVV